MKKNERGLGTRLISVYVQQLLWIIITLPLIYYDIDKVTLSQMVVLKRSGQSGPKVHIIDSAKHKWKDITSLISKDTNKISTLSTLVHSDPSDCLRQVLIECFIENKPQGYSQDWNGLIELLDDVGLQSLAEDIENVIVLNVHDSSATC